MIELSKDTKKLIKKFFADSSECEAISEKLRKECSDNIYSCGDGSPESLERIRFAVLKLYIESPENGIDYWLKIAGTDWRDLFMSAGFGHDIDAHIKWKNKTLTPG
jgi:hypothetical protein